MLIHKMSVEQLLTAFKTPHEAIEQVEISIAECGDMTTSDTQVQETLNELYEKGWAEVYGFNNEPVFSTDS